MSYLLTDPDLSAEQAIIAACLITPTNAAIVAERLTIDDFSHPLHCRIMAAVLGLSGEGRTASIQAVADAVGPEELEPGMTTIGYLRSLVGRHIPDIATPLTDPIETVREAAQRRNLALAGQLLTERARSHLVSVSEAAAQGVDAVDAVLSSLRQAVRRSYDAAGSAMSVFEHLEAQDRTYPTTGLTDLDEKLGGWPLGQLSIVAGRPGMGKSAMATSAVLRAAQSGDGVVFFSLEMQAEQLGSRLLTDLCFDDGVVLYKDILNRKIYPETYKRLREARMRLQGLPIWIEEKRGLTMTDIAARARKAAARFDRKGQRLRLIVVDHIGLVRASQRYSGNRVRELAEITDALATLAKDLDCAVVGLCQLNRQVEKQENKRPGLADLRESGAIEEDASAVVFVYRPAYYLEIQRFDDAAAELARQDALRQCRNKMEFIIAKNRNGVTGTVDAFVDIGAHAIRDLARDQERSAA